MSTPRPAYQIFYFGALVGLAGFAWEQCLALVWGVGSLTAAQVGLFALIYAGLGALSLGTLGFFSRRPSTLCWLLWMLTACGLLAGKWWAWKWSIPAALLLGLLFAALGATVLWLGDRRLIQRSPRMIWPYRTVAFAGLSTVFFLNLNVYGAAFSAPALWADACVFGGAIFLTWVLARGPMGDWEELKPGIGLQIVLGLWLFWGLPWVWFGEKPVVDSMSPSPDGQPPVVLIVVDTLRADHLTSYGYDRPTSPFLATFAKDALVFDLAQSTAPWTLPAFGSLLTGALPSGHGAGINPGMGNRESALSKTPGTLPEAFQSAGYETLGLVSNIYLKRAYGLDRGFKIYDDSLAFGHYPLLLQPLSMVLGPDWTGPPYLEAQVMATKANTALKQRRRDAFMLLHFMDPHAPYTPKAEALKVMDGSYADPEERLYDAEIRSVDDGIRAVVEALPEDAIVVITSDHGERFGEHVEAYPDWHPIRARHGMSQYQELLHIPLMIRAPGVEAGRVERGVSLVDLAASISSLAGVKWEGPGTPWPELTGATERIGQASVSESIRYGRERKSVRLEPWKAIWGPDHDELYHLGEDPKETKNLAKRHPDILEGLRVFLPKVTAETISPRTSTGTTEEALRSLGYVEE